VLSYRKNRVVEKTLRGCEILRAVELLAPLIDDIWNLNERFTLAFAENVDLSRYNFMKLGVSKMLEDKELVYNIIPSYTKFINTSRDLIESDLFIYSVQYNIRYRVKIDDTIYAKLKHYARKEKDLGTLPLDKCLNDIFGVRIILPNARDELSEILALLESKKKQRHIFRYVKRDLEKYHAVHCYMYPNKHSFPWELQIWDSRDVQQNTYSHLEHERKREVL